MAMQLERLQSQALVGNGPQIALSNRASRAQMACCLPPLRILTQRRTNLSASALQPGPQIYPFINVHPLFLLRSCDGPDRGKSKPLGVTQASAGKDSWDYDDGLRDSSKANDGFLVFIVNLVKKAIKLAGVILILSTAFAAAAPTILSTPRGLKSILALASYTIPGTASIAHASLGWRKPVYLEGITLKGVDGKTVVSISKVESRASLWSIVRGKKGLGAGLLPYTLLQVVFRIIPKKCQELGACTMG